MTQSFLRMTQVDGQIAVRLFAMLVCIAYPSVVSAEDLIACRAADNEFVITLDAMQHRGYVLSCVDGDFVVDLSGCAPDGAFGLHAPSGAAALGPIVDRWQDVMGHFGGVTSHFITNTKIGFTGGFATGTDYREDWRVLVDRLSGVGTVTTLFSWNGQTYIPDKQVSLYECESVSRRF